MPFSSLKPIELTSFHQADISIPSIHRFKRWAGNDHSHGIACSEDALYNLDLDAEQLSGLSLGAVALLIKIYQAISARLKETDNMLFPPVLNCPRVPDV